MSGSVAARRWCVLFVVAVCATALALPSSAQAGEATHAKHAMPARAPELNGPGNSENAASRAKTRTNGITYHGGPIITGGTNAYVIWYGNWPGTSTTPAILTNLLSGIGGSPYFNINTTYYNGANVKVSNTVTYKTAASDSYSQGTSLSDAGVLAVVARAINTGALPMDTNGVYFVLTSSDVKETSGFLSQYCGWHDRGTINGKDVKYSFVGDASANLAVCAQQTSKSPNGNPAADAMASVVAHELEEATTDPDLNAWYDSRGYENADKCAWTFGSTYNPGNGSLANVKLGGHDYLIQRNWVNASGGYCSMSY